MQICPSHWLQLRTAVSERGLDHLVSKSGEEAAQRMTNMGNGSSDPADFDPLMAANMAIISYYVSHIGIDGISEQLCPVCEAAKNSDADDLAENWINGSADDVLAVARSKGLITEQ